MLTNVTLLDLDDICEKYNYGMLFDLQHTLNKLKNNILAIKNEAVFQGALMEAVAAEQQLQFLERNLETVNIAILFKEDEAFINNDIYDMLCKN